MSSVPWWVVVEHAEVLEVVACRSWQGAKRVREAALELGDDAGDLVGVLIVDEDREVVFDRSLVEHGVGLTELGQRCRRLVLSQLRATGRFRDVHGELRLAGEVRSTLITAASEPGDWRASSRWMGKRSCPLCGVLG